MHYIYLIFNFIELINYQKKKPFSKEIEAGASIEKDVYSEGRVNTMRAASDGSP